MKKWFLMLACLLITVPGSVLASARLDGLSANVREVEDMDLIWLYPNKIIQYKNTVDFRLGDNFDPFSTPGRNEWGGVITGEMGLGVIGVYVNRPFVMPSAWAPLATPAFTPFTFFPAMTFDYFFVGGSVLLTMSNNQHLDVLWADSLGGGADLGVHVSYLNNFGLYPYGVDSQTYALGVGLGLSDFGPFSQFNLHVDYGFQNIAGSFGGPPSKDNGIYTLKAGFLAQAELGKDLFLKPFVDFQLDKTDLGGLSPSPFGSNGWALVLGTTCNHSILAGKGLVATGLSFGYNNNHFDDPGVFFVGSFDEILYQLVWNAFMEAEVYDWLTLRGGVATNLMARGYNDGNPLLPVWYDMSTSNVVYSVGFSLNWQNFTLDGGVQASSIEDSINNVQPGAGLFFPGSILTVTTADLKYKF
jgi:hypothetical protein